MPRAGTIYRCLVCRLELTLDPNTRKLALAPLPPVEPLKDRFNPG